MTNFHIILICNYILINFKFAEKAKTISKISSDWSLKYNYYQRYNYFFNGN